MAVEAMFTCASVMSFPPQGTQMDMHDREVPVQQHEVVLKAFVGDAHPYEDNTDWSVWTPEGTIEMRIMNADAAKYFVPGEDYRIVMTKRQPQKARPQVICPEGADRGCDEPICRSSDRGYVHYIKDD